MNLGFFDIEAENWIDVFILGYKNSSNQRYYTFDTIKEYVHFLLNEEKDIKIYAHNFGRYDGVFIFEYLLKNDIPFKYIINNGIIYEIRIGKRVILRDSYLLLLSSLENICKNFNNEYFKLDIDYKHIKDYDYKKYLYYDVCGLEEAFLKFMDILKLTPEKIPLSLQSLIIKILSRDYNINFTRLDNDVNEFCREGYFGGRVEIYKPEANKISVYDANSLYAYASKNMVFPSGKGRYLEKINYKLLDKYEGYAKVEIEVKKQFINLIPYKDKKIYWTYGKFIGVYPFCILKRFLDLNLGSIKFSNGIIFDKEKDILTNYINDYYKIKNDNKDKNKALAFIAKRFLAGVHGKLGQRSTGQKFIINPTIQFIKDHRGKIDIYNEKNNIWVYDINRFLSIQNTAISGYVTANSNMYIYNFLKKYENNLYYTDTDSLHLDINIPTSDKIGDFKLESTYTNIKYIQPKLYVYDPIIKIDPITKKQEIVDKGYKAKGLKDFNVKTMESRYNAPPTVKDLMSKNYLEVREIVKEVLNPYNTREKIKDKFFPKELKIFNDNILSLTGFIGIKCDPDKCKYAKLIHTNLIKCNFHKIVKQYRHLYSNCIYKIPIQNKKVQHFSK